MEIPSSVTKISNWAFRSCSNLTSIVIPDGVKTIGKEVFTKCNNLVSITIPESVTEIGKNAFKGCKNLTITAPAGSYAIEYAKGNSIKYVEA